MKTYFRICTGVILLLTSAKVLAQSAISWYGIIDTAMVYTTHQNPVGGTKIALDAGQLLTSRLGLKGTEDLGGGLKASFNVEMTLANDTGGAGASYGGGFVQGGTSANLFDRAAWVGLSGNFGNLMVGRINMVGVDSVGLADPLIFGHAGTNPNVMLVAMNSGGFFGGFGANAGGSVTRQNNSIKYISPQIGGFGGALMYAFGEKAGDASGSNYKGGSLFYTDGTNGAAVAVARLTDATNTSVLKVFGSGFKYQFNPSWMLRATYSYSKIEGDIQIPPFGNANGRKIAVTGIGVDYVWSPQITITSAIYDTRRSGDFRAWADQYIVMGKYAFSKRTTAYASLTHARAGSSNARDTSLALGLIGPGQSNANRAAIGIMHMF